MKDYKKGEGFKDERIIGLPKDFLELSSKHPLVNPLFVTNIGYFPHAQYHYRERTEGCKQNILIFCAKGKGFVQIGGKKRIIEKSNLLVIPKGIPHEYGSDLSEPWSIYWLHFDGNNAKHFITKNGCDNPIVQVAIEKVARLKLIFEEILDNLESGYTFDSMIYISQILCGFLGLLFFSSNSITNRFEKTTPIENTIALMNKNIVVGYTLQQFAEIANLSPTHFSHLFKEKTGFSVIDYFNRLKIQKACQYLDMTSLKEMKLQKN